MPKSLRDELQHIRDESISVEKLEEAMNAKDKKKKASEDEEELLLGQSKKPTLKQGDKEYSIREEEYKKTLINQLLAAKIGDHLESGQIKLQKRVQNLLGAPPKEAHQQDKITVVEDPDERYPTFEDVLYCSLDNQLLLLYIMYFMVFEAFVSNNSLLSMFFVYIIERILRKLRSDLGQSKMCEKTYIDECFLS